MLVKILLMRRDLFIITIKKKQRNIWTASKEDLRELKDEGIDADVIPWIEDKSN